MSSDERLALRASEGDERAFAEIYERYHQDLYRFCLAMVGDPQDAQDALQNAMVKVLRALPGEKREIKLKPWLYRIVRNESVEVLRRRRDSAELEPDQATTPGVAETAETRERLRILLADLEQLPERQRAALLMRELSGLDFTEIGTAFGSTSAVARQTLYEARLSLRRLEAGREMRCADVMRELSDADGRVTRRRDIRAHLRSCADCRAFRDGISKRQEDLAALSPLPVAVAAGLLHGLAGKATGGGAGVVSGGGVSGAGVAGKAVATSALVKTAATVAVVAVVGVSAAGRGGLIRLPVVSDGHDAAAPSDTGSHRAPTGGSPAEGSGSGAASLRTADRSAATGASGSGDGESRGDRKQGDKGRGAGSDASPGESPSSSQRGLIPPGGGYGRSASERHGRPEQAPEAAEHGQQTARSRKPAHVASPPGNGGSGGKSRSSAPRGGAGSEKPAAPGKAAPPTHPTPPSQPPAEVPAKSADRAANPESGAEPPGHER